MSTRGAIPKIKEPTLEERGVVSVWVVHEAWLFSMETIKKLFEEKKITVIKKRRLESKYTSFYQNSRPMREK